jgi:nitrite reductase (NADH) small subunit
MRALVDSPPEGAGGASLPEAPWRDACALEQILPDCGAAVLIDGRQIALVRVGEDMIYALSNYDPFSEAFVIARGIVGDRDGRAKIASPIFKHSFDLETGVCLDDPSVALLTYPVRIRAGRIELSLPGAGGNAVHP